MDELLPAPKLACALPADIAVSALVPETILLIARLGCGFAAGIAVRLLSRLEPSHRSAARPGRGGLQPGRFPDYLAAEEARA